MMDLRTDKLYYLATPYTHDSKIIRTFRYLQAEKAAVDLLKERGIIVFSPIAYNHPMVRYNLPTSWEFWEQYDKTFLKKCDEVIVLMLKGWEESTGVTAEIKYAEENGIKVNYLDPEKLKLDMKSIREGELNG